MQVRQVHHDLLQEFELLHPRFEQRLRCRPTARNIQFHLQNLQLHHSHHESVFSKRQMRFHWFQVKQLHLRAEHQHRLRLLRYRQFRPRLGFRSLYSRRKFLVQQFLGKLSLAYYQLPTGKYLRDIHYLRYRNIQSHLRHRDQ